MTRILDLLLTFIMFICAMRYWQYDLGAVRLTAVDITTLMFDYIAVIYFWNQGYFTVQKGVSRTLILFNISIFCMSVLSFFLIDKSSDLAMEQYTKGVISLASLLLFITLFVLYLERMTQHQIEVLVRTYIFGAVASSVWSIAEVYLGLSGVDLNRMTFGAISTYKEEGSFMYEWGNFFRSSGFAGVNAQGTYVMSVIPLLLIWEPIKQRHYNSIALILCFIGVLLTMSKNALLGLAASVLFILIYRPRFLLGRYRLILASLLPLALMAVVLWDDVVYFFSTRFGDLLIDSANFANGRKEIYYPTLDAIFRHPLGYGLGQFYVHITSKDTIDLSAIVAQTGLSEYEARAAFANAHNNWLNWLFEFGISGLILLICYYVWIVWSLARSGARLAVAAASSVIGLMVSGFFNSTLDQFSVQLFAVLMLMAASCREASLGSPGGIRHVRPDSTVLSN